MTISNIALSVQTAGISILFFLFAYLTRHDKRLYLKYWTVSWLLYAVSLGVLLTSFLNHVRWPYALYQILELGSVAMVTAAGMNYSNEFRLQRKHGLLFLPAVVWSVSSTWVFEDFNGLYMFHSLLMASAFAYNAYVFFTSRWYRSNGGTRLLAFTCTLISLMGFHYAVVFGYAFHRELGSISYLHFTSFYDLLMQYVLAIGMVVMGMKENQHRLQLTNSQLQEAQDRLRFLAQTDPLTGVYNRHAFREICDREFRPENLQKSPHALVLLDIDNLKKINDLVGHSTGDEVLRTVARTISSMIRGEDCLVRWGGDEFLLLMRGTDLSQARQRMKQVAEQLSHQCVISPVGRIYFGISYGEAALVTLDGLPASIEEADRNMYKRKQQSKKSMMMV